MLWVTRNCDWLGNGGFINVRNMDTRTPEKRSEIMSLVRSKNTKPEIIVRRLAHGLGYRFRLHSQKLPGRPDVVFPSRRKAIFVHGCFWHGHRGCAKARPPKSREDYWLPKLQANKDRDAQNRAALRSLGWRSLVVWQCELRDLNKVGRRLSRFLADQSRSDKPQREKSHGKNKQANRN